MKHIIIIRSRLEHQFSIIILEYIAALRPGPAEWQRRAGSLGQRQGQRQGQSQRQAALHL